MDREGWNQRYSSAELLWTAEPNRFLVAEVTGMAPGRALDVATGEGRNAVWLAEQGWEVDAVDFSDIGLAKGRRLAESRGVAVNWVLADVLRQTPEPESYDLVVILYLHLSSDGRRRVHSAAARALAPNGTLLVVGHDRSNLDRGYGGPQDPVVLFTPEEVVDDLAGVRGISVIRAERVTRQVPTDDGERTAIDAMVRATRSRHDAPDRPV